MVQVPAERSVTVVSETVQTESVREVKVTVRPDEEVAESDAVPLPNLRSTRDAKVIVCAPTFTFKVKLLVVALAELLSVTRIDNEYEPVVVGVPERVPVDALRESPGGNDPVATAKLLLPLPPEEERDNA